MSQHTSPSPKVGKKGMSTVWALTLGALYLTILGILWITLGDGDSDNPWVTFLGRFHFLLLHIPIGLLPILLAIEVAGIFPRFRPARAAATFILWFAACGGIGATIFGFLLSRSGGYGEVLLERHMWSGIGVAIGTVLALVFKTMFDQKPSLVRNFLYKAVLTLTVGTLFVASHFGGSLTHGSDFLTKEMPLPLKKLVGLAVAGEVAAPADSAAAGANAAEPAAQDQLGAYHDVIAPIFEEKCWSCHQESKQKGKLRMDTFALLMKGGSSGVSVVPGDLDESELFYRITTDDEDDRMPPEGKTPMTEAEIALVQWWIEQGAPEDKKLADLTRPTEVQKLLDAHAKERAAAPPVDAEKKKEILEKAAGEKEAKAARAKKLQAVAQEVSKAIGVPIMATAQGEDAFQFSTVNVVDTFDDAALAQLKPMREGLVDVNLARTKVSDKGLVSVAEMERLKRLHLENTAITDAGLAHIEGLGALEYLNLYGTQVTDAGIAQLVGLKNLKNLYVWQTGVTRAGAKKLVAQIPNLVVNLGWDNEVPGPPPAPPEAKKKKKKAKKPTSEKKKKEQAKKPAAEKKKEKPKAKPASKDEAPSAPDGEI